MKGRIPKPGLRRSHHRPASTRATLPTEAEAAQQEIPPLPTRTGMWHERVIDWWESVWKSPMASEYLEVDRHGLYMLATLHQAFWTARAAKDRFRYAVEIRQQEARFGLTPVDRRRLQWEIERAETAAQQTAVRRQRKRADPEKDPRDVLYLE